MPINPAARRQAINWLAKSDEQQAHPQIQCPHRLSDLPESIKIAELSASKPEFYGRTAEIITAILNYSFSMRTKRGEIGLSWLESPYVHNVPGAVKSSEISSFDGLGEAFYQTLLADSTAVFQSIRTPEDEKRFDYETFEKYLSLQGIVRYRRALQAAGIGQIEASIAAGIYTATTHIAKLLEAMSYQYGEKPELYDIIAGSYNPLLRLANLDARQLDYFDTNYLVLSNKISLFQITNRGTIDLLPEIIADIESSPSGHEPTIGCPVTLYPTATKQLWQWGASAAYACGLLTPVPCR